VRVRLELTDEQLEAIAERVAELLADRDREQHGDDGWLDVAGAAEHLSCPASRIYSLTSSGRIPVHRDGSRLLFRRSELDAYVAAGGARRS
jgi:excisionase family DNA binding protein